MKRLVVLVAAFAMLMVSPGTASADALQGTGCIMFNAEGDRVYVPEAEYRVTINTYQGNGVLVCTGDVDDTGVPVPGSFLVGLYADDVCFAKGQDTDIIRQTTAPNGTATLVCRFNYSSP
jgi:hypothetical protein